MPTPLFLLDRPLTNGDLVTYDEQLRQLQGNILKSHGRNETASIFLTFLPGQIDGVRDFLHTMARRVTSAQQQEAQARARERNELFTGLWLSAEGYKFLGHSLTGFDLTFRQGMRGAKERLDDPPVENWEPKFREQIHALVTFAHSDRTVVSAKLDDLRGEVGSIASVSSELGHAMRDGDRAFEHFGFLDGVSQPIFFAKDLPDATSRAQWDPSAGPRLVLRQDPLGTREECGSYFVFRKLEQNAKRFKLRQKALARKLGVSTAVAGAMIMGRFEDGTPITKRQSENGRRENDFNYGADGHGHVCPFFSHIRKANPRGATDNGIPGAEGVHRIARRGITYGDPTPRNGSSSHWPENGVGVLFQCCQAVLSNQFETIQGRWANDPSFIRAGVGQDAVIGQRGQTRIAFPAGRGSAARVPFDFGEFIHMRGGEYFFAPAKSVLVRL